MHIIMAGRTGMARVTFRADTTEDLVERALSWALETLRASRHATVAPGAPGLISVVDRVRGPQAREFLRAVAERSLGRQTLTLANASVRFGRDAEPTAFLGLVGSVNRPMRRVGGRRLILWEPTTRGYRMDASDAAVVLEALGE
jgi:hypothetical protein